MFRWYRNATKCYVYLSHVSKNDHDEVDPFLESWLPAFRESRWFTRGWTLQELIAPASVEFFSSSGKRLGDKKSLERQLHEITGITVLALQRTPLSEFSVKERMSWAENRQTKREEDKAYSLLGIFEIHIPLIYGEGAKNAFGRFQEELDKRLRKHQLDELSTAIQAASNSTKRLKTLHSQSHRIPSNHDRSFLDPEPLCSEISIYSKTQKEPVTRDNYGIDATTKQSLIDLLYFTKIDERLTSLTAAQGTTCRWFLTKPEYVSWHNLVQQSNHSGFLWIKGNPGTGKSTLMKLLFEEAKLNAKDDFSQITLSFFFLARGTVEEKSTTGLYRSLLHQLFEKVVELRDSLEWLTGDGARVIQRNGWGEEALKQTLTHVVRKLGNQSLTIFIDALDECDKSQATGMICFFEELCDLAKEAQVRLKICLSSRHYPTIVIQHGIEVTLEDELGHIEDMKQFIRSKLRLGRSKQAESLRSEILEKSSGIFLWVVLVLDILNSEYPDNLVSIKKIRERLKEIPPKLTDLFEMILTRDGENFERLQLCLKWIFFTTYPLKPQELYFAIQFGLDKECSGYWDQEDVELDQMKTFVRSSSKGLAEVTRNKASEVQFIHESVRDFLLSKYEGKWSGDSGNFVGHCHKSLRDCCLAQLNVAINQEVDIPDPLPKSSKASQLRETICLKFPFLEYSVLNILRHANSAQQNEMEQKDFLADFPLQRWIFLNNALARYDVRRYTKSVTLLYILAEKNLANLIQIHPQRESCFDIESERYGLPILAALATGGQEAVQSFLEVQTETHQQEPLLYYPSKLCSGNGNKRTKLKSDFTFSRRRSVFSNIAELGDEVVLAFHCALGKLDDLESKGSYGRTPLSEAAANGYEAVVEWLLGKDADLESKDYRDRTPLSWAVENGNETIVKLLLEKGADIESKSYKYQTPLSCAAEKGHEAVVKLLLEKGANLESKDINGWTPLFWAAKHRYEATVKMLLDTGKIDVDTKDKDGRTSLSWAAEKSHEATVKMLLDTGKVDVNSKDKNGLTPLLWAATRMPFSYATEKEHGAVVKMLLDTGKVDVDSKDKDGRTTLSWAAEEYDEAIVKLLLDTSKVDVNWKDKDGFTPLSRATARIAKVEMQLSKSSCDGNHALQDYHMQLTLQYEAVAKLLLAADGVDPNSKDLNGQTLLSLAAEDGQETLDAAIVGGGWDAASTGSREGEQGRGEAAA
ncbi:hypothetical protein B7463_g10972, partial [Scytalidium lignicola]